MTIYKDTLVLTTTSRIVGLIGVTIVVASTFLIFQCKSSLVKFLQSLGSRHMLCLKAYSLTSQS